MNDLPTAPHSIGYKAPEPSQPPQPADPDGEKLSWVSALLIAVPGAFVAGIAYWVMVTMGVIIVGAIDIDTIDTLNSEDEVVQFIEDKAGQVLLVFVGVAVVLAPVLALVYKLFLDLLFDHVVPFGWMLLAIIVGWIVAPLGVLVDLLLAGLTLGLASALANGLATAALMRVKSRPKASA